MANLEPAVGTTVASTGGSGTLRRVAIIAVQLSVSVAALTYVLWDVDFHKTVDSFREANYWLFIPAVLFLLLDLHLRAVRWRLLLRPQSGLRHSHLFGATNVGYLVNDVLPFRAGEVARLFLIDELAKTGKVRAGASIVVERGIDVVAMILLVIVLFPFIDEPGWARGPALLFGAMVFTGFIVALVLSHLGESPDAFWKAWLRRIPRIGLRLEEVVDTLLRALQPLRDVRVLAAVVGLTVAIWISAILSFLMVMYAFHLGVGFAAAALVLGATTLAMVVPSSPGYVGVFPAAAVPTLVSVFGIAEPQALTYAFAQHGLIYVVPAALGAWFLLTQRAIWSRLTTTLRRAT